MTGDLVGLDELMGLKPESGQLTDLEGLTKKPKAPEVTSLDELMKAPAPVGTSVTKAVTGEPSDNIFKRIGATITSGVAGSGVALGRFFAVVAGGLAAGGGVSPENFHLAKDWVEKILEVNRNQEWVDQLQKEYGIKGDLGEIARNVVEGLSQMPLLPLAGGSTLGMGAIGAIQAAAQPGVTEEPLLQALQDIGLGAAGGASMGAAFGGVAGAPRLARAGVLGAVGWAMGGPKEAAMMAAMGLMGGKGSWQEFKSRVRSAHPALEEAYFKRLQETHFPEATPEDLVKAGSAKNYVQGMYGKFAEAQQQIVPLEQLLGAPPAEPAGKVEGKSTYQTPPEPPAAGPALAQLGKTPTITPSTTGGLESQAPGIEYLQPGGVAEHVGEGGWSPEALSRQKTTGFVIYDTRTKTIRPLIGVEAVDTQPQAGEIKFQKDLATGSMTVADLGPGTTASQAAAALQQKSLIAPRRRGHGAPPQVDANGNPVPTGLAKWIEKRDWMGAVNMPDVPFGKRKGDTEASVQRDLIEHTRQQWEDWRDETLKKSANKRFKEYYGYPPLDETPEQIKSMVDAGDAILKGEGPKPAAPAVPAPPETTLAQPIPRATPRTAPLVSKDFRARTAETARLVTAIHNKEGGSTVNLWQGSLGKNPNVPEDRAWAVSLYPERTVPVDGPKVTARDIQAFIRANADLLTDPRNSVGTWFNKDKGKTYIDVSTVTDHAKAVELAKRFNRISIFNLKTFQEEPTGGTGEPVTPIEPEGQRLSLRPGEGTQPIRLYHFSDMQKGTATITPQAMGRGQMGQEGAQLEESGRVRPNFLMKSAWYTVNSKQVDPHRWGGRSLYQTDVDMSQLKVLPKDQPIPKNIDYLTAQEGKIGWYDERTGQVRLIAPVEAERVGTARFLRPDYRNVTGKNMLRYVETLPGGGAPGLAPAPQPAVTAMNPPGQGIPPEPPGAGEPPGGPRIIGGKPYSPTDPIIKQAAPGALAGTQATLDQLKMQVPLKEAKMRLFETMPFFFEKHPFFKSMLYDPITDASGQYIKDRQGIEGQIGGWREQLKNEPTLSAMDQKTATRIGIYAIHMQSDGDTALKSAGIQVIPELTPTEMTVYNDARAGLEQMWHRINDARAIRGLQPIGKIENYFTFLRNAKAMDMIGTDLIFEPNAARLTQKLNEPGFEFGKHRTPSNLPVETQFFKVYEYYMKKAARYIAYAKPLASWDVLMSDWNTPGPKGKTETFSYREHDPNMYNFLNKWMQYSVSRQASDAMKEMPIWWAKKYRQLNQNLGGAVLAFNFRTALLHAFKIVNANVEIGPKYMIQGVTDNITSSSARAMADSKSRVLGRLNANTYIEELMEEPGLVSKLSKVMTKADDVKLALTKLGMTPLQFLNTESARATWLGAYRQGLDPVSKGGEGLDERGAIVYADDVVAKTQGTASPHDISQFQRYPSFRMFTMFQTFVFNNFNYYLRDVFGFRNPDMTPADVVKKSMRLAIGVAAANLVFEGLLRVRSPYPTPEWAVIRGLQEGKDWKDIVWDAVKEFSEPIPIVGGMIRWSTPYKTMVPAQIQLGSDAIRAMMKVKEAILGGDFSQFKPEDYSVVGRALGFPGMSEAEKIVRRREKGASWLESFMGIRPELIDQAGGLGGAFGFTENPRSKQPAGQELSPEEQEILKRYGR